MTVRIEYILAHNIVLFIQYTIIILTGCLYLQAVCRSPDCPFKRTQPSHNAPISDRFYQFVFQWYDSQWDDSSTSASGSMQFSKAAASHESAELNRRALYNGVKALVNEGDHEAALFWCLLSDGFGSDGCYFTLSCLSRLLKGVAESNGSVATARLNEYTQDVIWVPLTIAHTVAKECMLRASQQQVDETSKAIDTFSSLFGDSEEKGDNSDPPERIRLPQRSISMFMWLRIMLRQMQGDQYQRAAALQVMLDATLAVASDGEGTVRCPNYFQFSAIIQSLYSKDDKRSYDPTSEGHNYDPRSRAKRSLVTPHEVMEMYNDCYFNRRDAGGRMTVEGILAVAEQRGLAMRAFARA